MQVWPGGGEDARHHTHRGVGDVGVLEDDVRRFAAEFQACDPMNRPAAADAMRAPVAVLPVNEILASAG